MKPVHRQLLALLLAVVLGSALCLSLYVWDNKSTRPAAQPMDGLLTLTDEELGQTDLHCLVHGWACYPGVLLTPEEWTAHGTEHYMSYTSIGERTRFDQPDGVTPHGCGTYALTLDLPETPAQYGLELPEIYSAYRLYLNGNLELQVGEPDLKHYQPRTQNRMVTFTGSGLTTILLAVRDDSHFYSGLVYSMLDIPEDCYSPLFAASRMVGWLAHNIENKLYCDKIVRPAGKYVGDLADYIPLAQRQNR